MYQVHNWTKYIIFAVNFLIWSLGVLLLTASVWIRGDGGLFEYTQALDIHHYYKACYLSIAIGTMLLIVGFLGCLGAALESPFILLFYSIVIGICMLLEITASVLVWKVAGGERLQRILEQEIKEHIKVRNYNDRSRRFLDLIQLKLECCGAETFVDYKKLGQDIPASCNSDRTNNVHIRSCGENLRRYLEVRGGIIGGLCISLLLMQIFSLLVNFVLIWLLKVFEQERDHLKRSRYH